MKSELNDYSLEIALTIFSSELMRENIEFFPFFGTLLGLIREGGPISNDDDVDFYVNISHYESVKSILRSLNFQIDYTTFPNHTKIFIQATGVILEQFIRVDFYFFDKDIDPDFLIERWNFRGQIANPQTVLKVPKPLVFPLRKMTFRDICIPVPNYSEIICEYLYGENWRQPQRKDVDYRTVVLGGRPIRFRETNGNMQLIP